MSYHLDLCCLSPGVKHQNITCNGCHQEGILGMRWKCLVCEDYDLCSVCYFGGKHDMLHEFVRLLTQNSAGYDFVVLC